MNAKTLNLWCLGLFLTAVSVGWGQVVPQVPNQKDRSQGTKVTAVKTNYQVTLDLWRSRLTRFLSKLPCWLSAR